MGGIDEAQSAEGDGCGSESPHATGINYLKTAFQNKGVSDHLRPDVINILNCFKLYA